MKKTITAVFSVKKTAGLNSYLLQIYILIAAGLLALYSHAEENISPDAPAVKITPTPAWVQPIAFDATKPLSNNQSTQYLLIDSQINLDAISPEYYYRQVVRPINATGVDESAHMQISFSPSYQKLTLHTLKIYRQHQTFDLTKTVAIRMLNQEKGLDQDLHDGFVTAAFILEDIRENDIVEYSYTVTGKNPIFGNMSFGYAPLNWGVKVDQLNLRIITKNENLQFKSFGPHQELARSLSNGKIEYHLSLQDIAPVLDEGEYPPDFSPYSWLEYSDYASWDEVNRQATLLYNFATYDVAPVKKIAAELSTANQSDEQFVSTALHFVQNDIRYLGLEFGKNSHLPHAPDEVLKKRFGDCKDKAALLVAILKERNINSYPALVSTKIQSAIGADLPSLGAFNHVITMVDLNNKHYWLDGTQLYQEGSLDNLGATDYGYALVIGYADSALIKMYPQGLAPMNLNYQEDIYTDNFTGDATYAIQSTLTGLAAEYQRYRFKNISTDNLQKASLSFYQQYYQNITALEPINFTDDKKNNVAIIKESYRLNGFWGSKNGFITANNKILDFTDFLKKPNVRTRTSNYYLGAPAKINMVYRIHFPEEIDLKLDNKPTVYSNPVFTYQFSETYEDRVYTYTATLDRHATSVTPDNLNAYLELIEKLNKEWAYTLYFKDPGSFKGYREILKLKQRLKVLSHDQNEK